MSSSVSTTIPHDWRPRPHQLNLFDRFGHGKRYKRGCAVWHRRAGKDSCALNLTARDMFRRVGSYWHLFPEQAQARRAVWNGIDGQGRRIIDQVLPPQVRARTSGQEMLIETLNGSMWQMAGSDTRRGGRWHKSTVMNLLDRLRLRASPVGPDACLGASAITS